MTGGSRKNRRSSKKERESKRHKKRSEKRHQKREKKSRQSRQRRHLNRTLKHRSEQEGRGASYAQNLEASQREYGRAIGPQGAMMAEVQLAKTD
jgi:hypothetical protein